MRKKIFWKIHSGISTDISKPMSEGKREKRARRYTCVASLHATVRCFPSICCNREISLSLIFCKFVNTTRKHNLKARIFIHKNILHIVPITLSISNSFLIWKKYFINFSILKHSGMSINEKNTMLKEHICKMEAALQKHTGRQKEPWPKKFWKYYFWNCYPIDNAHSQTCYHVGALQSKRQRQSEKKHKGIGTRIFT